MAIVTSTNARTFDPLQAYLHARGFLRAANHIGEKQDQYVFAPQIVLETVSLELLLKCLYALENPGQSIPPTHGVTDLFWKLRCTGAVQFFVRSCVDQSEQIRKDAEMLESQLDILSILARCESLLDRLRHGYETQLLSRDERGLAATIGIDALLWALDRLILEFQPEWKQLAIDADTAAESKFVHAAVATAGAANCRQ